MPELRTGKLLRIFVDLDDRWRGQLLYHAIVEVFRARSVRGATVLRGIEGYGSHREIHVAKIIASMHLPAIIEVVDDAEAIECTRTALEEMVPEGLMTTQNVEYARFGSLEVTN